MRKLLSAVVAIGVACSGCASNRQMTRAAVAVASVAVVGGIVALAAGRSTAPCQPNPDQFFSCLGPDTGDLLEALAVVLVGIGAPVAIAGLVEMPPEPPPVAPPQPTTLPPGMTLPRFVPPPLPSASLKPVEPNAPPPPDSEPLDAPGSMSL